jgi:transposase-like protein
VEIDESKFGKRKYNRGRLRDGKWVFGGCERGSDKGFMVIVDDRTAATLLPIIQDKILPGTYSSYSSCQYVCANIDVTRNNNFF